MVECQELINKSEAPAMSESQEYDVDGNVLNKLLEPFSLEAYQPTSELHHMLSGQVFDTIEKKLVKGGKRHPGTLKAPSESCLLPASR